MKERQREEGEGGGEYEGEGREWRGERGRGIVRTLIPCFSTFSLLDLGGNAAF